MLLDRFFDGTFFTYGIEVMSFADRDQEDRIDPVRRYLGLVISLLKSRINVRGENLMLWLPISSVDTVLSKRCYVLTSILSYK